MIFLYVFLDAHAHEIATRRLKSPCQISQRRLIDIDEAGFELSRVNRNYGHSITFFCIRKQGHLTRDTKLTARLANEPGDPASLPSQRQRWHVRGRVCELLRRNLHRY